MQEFPILCGICHNIMEKDKIGDGDYYKCHTCFYHIKDDAVFCEGCHSRRFPFYFRTEREVLKETNIVSCVGSICSNMGCFLYKITTEDNFINLYYDDILSFSLDMRDDSLSMVIWTDTNPEVLYRSKIDGNSRLSYFIREVINLQIIK